MQGILTCVANELALATGQQSVVQAEDNPNYRLLQMLSINQRQVRPVAKATEFRILTMV